jgi:hypothetical protein
MTVATDRPPVRATAPARRRRAAVIGLAVALAAGAGLLFLPTPGDEPDAPAGPVPMASAWPKAQRADLPGNVPDGPVFQPGLFLDARTVIGTAPSADAESLRLLLRRADGTLDELRRLPLEDDPAFDSFAVSGRDVVWTESAGRGVQVWTATVDTGTARRLTADTGDPVFYGSQHDLVIADGRVHWAAAAPAPGGSPAPDGAPAAATEIRSVPLTGGAVSVRTEPGAWAQTAWPWLVEGGVDGTGTTRLRNPSTSRDVAVDTTGAELAACSPVWCRVVVMGGDGPARVDLMRPDGAERRRIAGGGAVAAVTDVAVLDRFEILAEPVPGSDLTGEQRLLVYDVTTGRTVVVADAVSGAFSRAGVLWWSTGDQDSLAWHTLDLRTV